MIFRETGTIFNGNWISGIKFIDEARLGKLDKLPADLKTNPGNNKYYFLPFLIGIAGMFWQYNREKKGFWLVTGIFYYDRPCHYLLSQSVS